MIQFGVFDPSLCIPPKVSICGGNTGGGTTTLTIDPASTFNVVVSNPITLVPCTKGEQTSVYYTGNEDRTVPAGAAYGEIRHTDDRGEAPEKIQICDKDGVLIRELCFGDTFDLLEIDDCTTNTKDYGVEYVIKANGNSYIADFKYPSSANVANGTLTT